MDSINYCGFYKIACFRSDFEQYSVLATCPWNVKQQRKSKKSSIVAGSATNVILAFCGISLPFTKSIVWPLYDNFYSKVFAESIKNIQLALDKIGDK